MDKLHEMIDFIESDTMRDFLKDMADKNTLSLSDEKICSIVWNCRQALSVKQAFLMDYKTLPVAIDMIKRFEAVRLYLQENHKNEVYVLLINDKFYGVYNRYDVAKEDFLNFSEYTNEDSDISLEMYDIEGSKYRGRLTLDETFEVTSFDFSSEVIQEEKLWNNEDTDKCINMYIKLPHPFMEGDIISLAGSLDMYKIVNCDLPDDLFGELTFGDIAVEAVPFYEDEDDMEDLKSADSSLCEAEHELLPLLKINLD